MLPENLPIPETLCQVFFHGAQLRSGKGRFLSKRDGRWHPVLAEEFARKVRAFAGGLRGVGIRPGDRVAILSYNRLEWAIADYGAITIGAVSVPLYSTLPGDQCDYILRDSGAKLLVVENAEQAEKVRPYLRDLPLVNMEDGSWEEFLHGGEMFTEEEHRSEAARVRPEDLATIIYTSGTTGLPKGVMLTHRNLTSNLVAAAQVLHFSQEDLALSFLPLSHVFERMVDYALFAGGATIAYAESIEKVGENLLEVRPTILGAVPRFYEKIYGRIRESVAAQPPKKRRIFEWAIRIGGLEAAYRMRGQRPPWGLRFKYGIARRLVLRKLHARVGGRIRFFISGGAPLSREIAQFFFAMGFTILEGYGLSETSPVLTVAREGEVRLGTVGKPVPGVEIRIAEDGEILARGPNVMKGYFNLPEETAAVLTEDGWFHTGDVGEFDAEGYLRITDRKKDLCKTSGGKYIAPQPIENRLKMHPAVANAVVIADHRHFPSTLIVPNFDIVRSELRIEGEPEDLVREARVRQFFQGIIDETNKDLAQYEKIKRFECLPRDFSIDTGELTPTMKVRRRAVEERYRGVIESLYQS